MAKSTKASKPAAPKAPSIYKKGGMTGKKGC
jgi:hypothetical protein